MLIQKYVAQPAGGVDYLTLFRLALDSAEFTSFDAAVAYVTLGGIKAVESLFDGGTAETWLAMRKRWLVSIDWFRSEPLALERFTSMRNSTARVHDGRNVINRKGCIPNLPFHPKTFILQGPDAIAVITGSGNLSRNGLTRGHEVGTLLLLANPLEPFEEQLWDSCQEVVGWFDNRWNAATPYRSIRNDYERKYTKPSHLKAPTPTDDDAAETGLIDTSPGRRRRALSSEQLRQLRACQQLWIQAGNLHKNRGPGRPGNQLMLSPMTRVFFGFQAQDLDRDTYIGHVAIEYGGHIRGDCSLRFSNNAMDVLGLPIPGTEGPAQYDQETLMFERRADGTFGLTLGSAPHVRQWQQKSAAIGADYSMTSGRRWGVF